MCNIQVKTSESKFHLCIYFFFSYGVSSLIGSQESEPTSWFEVPVPPRFDNSDHLIIEKKENGSVFIAMDNNDKNHRCKVRYLI